VNPLATVIAFAGAVGENAGAATSLHTRCVKRAQIRQANDRRISIVRGSGCEHRICFRDDHGEQAPDRITHRGPILHRCCDGPNVRERPGALDCVRDVADRPKNIRCVWYGLDERGDALREPAGEIREQVVEAREPLRRGVGLCGGVRGRCFRRHCSILRLGELRRYAVRSITKTSDWFATWSARASARTISSMSVFRHAANDSFRVCSSTVTWNVCNSFCNTAVSSNSAANRRRSDDSGAYTAATKCIFATVFPVCARPAVIVKGRSVALMVAARKIPVAPTANAAKPKVIREEIEVFTDDEVVRAIRKASEGNRFEALYNLAIGTGAREGKLLALELADFDLEEDTVRIVKSLDERDGVFILNPLKSKTGVRTVGLPAFAVEALRRHLKDRQPGPVFTTGNGTYMTRTNFIRKGWRPLLAKAEVKYRKFHTTRHTHASRHSD
jgi:integrase